MARCDQSPLTSGSIYRDRNLNDLGVLADLSKVYPQQAVSKRGRDNLEVRGKGKAAREGAGRNSLMKVGSSIARGLSFPTNAQFPVTDGHRQIFRRKAGHRNRDAHGAVFELLYVQWWKGFG